MYFFDTYALIEVIDESSAYERFQTETITTSILNMGELYLSLLRNFNKKTAEYWFRQLKENLVGVNVQTILKAMELKQEHKELSFNDCVGYRLAEELDLVFLTGDKNFKGLPNVELVSR